MDGKPTSEIVYVHSKFLVVDDQYLLIGSANINDRSMMGVRDSELAVVVNEEYEVIEKDKVQKEKILKEIYEEIDDDYDIDLTYGNQEQKEESNQQILLEDKHKLKPIKSVNLIHEKQKQRFIKNFKKQKRLEGVRNFRIQSWRSIFGLEAPEKQYWDFVPDEIVNYYVKQYDENMDDKMREIDQQMNNYYREANQLRQQLKNLIYLDPLDEDFLRLLKLQTIINEIFFWEVFGFYPHNSLKTLKDCEMMQENFKLNQPFYYKHRDKVNGFAQPFPVYFLCDEKDILGYKSTLQTQLVPVAVFTQLYFIKFNYQSSS